MKTCYIVGAGEIYSVPTPEASDFLIAADGGYDHLISHGITPNLLMGDLDSIKEVPSDIELLRFPEKKDETDMLLAFLEGYSLGYRNFSIYGGVGGRDDHTYANYSLLLFAKNRGCRAVLKMRDYDTEILRNETVKIHKTEKKSFSLFAVGGNARVSIRGALFNGEDIILTPEFPLGVSNKYHGDELEIEVSEGTVLAFL